MQLRAFCKNNSMALLADILSVGRQACVCGIKYHDMRTGYRGIFRLNTRRGHPSDILIKIPKFYIVE